MSNNEDSPINFFNEEIDFSPEHPEQLREWINSTIEEGNSIPEEINYIFCSDEYLHKINVEHLDHDTYTDIITFDMSDLEDHVASDIYISVDRVKENASKHSVTFTDELHRVMIHGILHLIGYNDKTEEEKALMRKKEDACLSLRRF